MTRQMTAKSFLFVAAWMQPLKALPLEQRWNVMEAIVEYSISGEVTMSLDVMETVAFGFIRNEIDRMKEFRAERRETRRAAAKSRWSKEKLATHKTEETASSDASDANACKAEQADAPYYILSESKSESESESESEKKSSTTSCVRARVRGDSSNQAKRKRKKHLQAIADGGIPSVQPRGMQSVDKYIDPDGSQTYNGVYFIPNGAPPRPGKVYPYLFHTRKINCNHLINSNKIINFAQNYLL